MSEIKTLPGISGAEHTLCDSVAREQLTTLQDVVDTLNEGGLDIKDEYLAAQIDDWLSEHPEATTTVQDGALTEPKFSNALKLKTIKDYVTPEMYGAIGDNIADDTNAIQEAIDSGANLIVLTKTYLTTSTIIINRSLSFVNYGTIHYTGNCSAIRVESVLRCNLNVGTISALNGNCLELYASTYEANATIKNRVQYADITFTNMSAGDKCIYLNLDIESGLDASKVGWINEVRIFNGRFASGNYGIYGDAKGYDKINNIEIYNTGIEGVTTGIYMANKCNRWSFNNIRCAESFTTLIKTVGNIPNFMFYASQQLANSVFDFSDNTYGVIYNPYKNSGLVVDGVRVVNNGEIADAISPTVRSLINKVTTVTTRYVSTDIKTIFDHGIIPNKNNNSYFLVMGTYARGDVYSIYFVQVYNSSIGSIVPVYEGTAAEAPLLSSIGELTKRNSTSTSSIKSLAIALG